MPSVIIGATSGTPQLIISGNPWSGSKVPTGGIQFRLAKEASGAVYMGFSGGLTMNSGGMQGSGLSGLLDGTPVYPGDVYFIPKIAVPAISGIYNVYAWHDVAASGQARLYYEPF